MSWGFWFVFVPTVCYAGAMVYYLLVGAHQMAIIYSGYAWANVGLLWLEALRTR